MPRLKTPKPPCSVQDCNKESWRLYDVCRMHQARLMRTGSLEGIAHIRAINKEAKEEASKYCKEEGCNELRVQQFRCEWHYDDFVERRRLRNQDNYQLMLEMEDIDYDDYWEWVKKELKLDVKDERAVATGKLSTTAGGSQ